MLYREFDGSWQAQVTVTGGFRFRSDELATLKAELVKGIGAAGFQAKVRDVSAPPQASPPWTAE